MLDFLWVSAAVFNTWANYVKFITKWSIWLNIGQSDADFTVCVCDQTVPQEIGPHIKASVCFLNRPLKVCHVWGAFVSQTCLSHLYSLLSFQSISQFFPFRDWLSFLYAVLSIHHCFHGCQNKIRLWSKGLRIRSYSQRNAGMREINSAYPAYDGHMPVIVSGFCVSKETDSPRKQKVKDWERDCMSQSLL